MGELSVTLHLQVEPPLVVGECKIFGQNVLSQSLLLKKYSWDHLGLKCGFELFENNVCLLCLAMFPIMFSSKTILSSTGFDSFSVFDELRSAPKTKRSLFV